MSSDRIGILYPNGALCSTVGSWAMNRNWKLTLFCPGEAQKEISKAIVLDLTVLAIERSRLWNATNDAISITSQPKFSGCKYLLVPNIDSLSSQSDEEYVHLCFNTFRWGNMR